MELVLIGISVMLAGAFVSLFLSKNSFVGPACAIAGSAVAVMPALETLVGGEWSYVQLQWNLPFAEFSACLDSLSAFFLLPILVLTAVTAAYGMEYMSHYRDKRNIGIQSFFFNLLVASMVTVVIARNNIMFLIAWETMSLASYFLVTFDDEREEVRRAGFIYLVATHIGTAFLLVMFILLGESGTVHASALFVCAVIGFGTKAGFVPMHVWLPEAHPAAPSHVSALMSGVMIKVGIYGLVRTLTQLGTPIEWWAWTLIGIGVTSGILGVLFALAQHDLKRLLAYHSVENIGIITMGLGLGLLGICRGSAALAVLGFAGGLLHVWNHAVFKALLFLCAGSVAHATGTREIDRLGGLMKKMPVTAATFLTGAIAICGIPPLNGFVSEFLIYVGGINGVAHHSHSSAIAGIITIGGLALIGGLAVACFTKAFGIVFLGEPRTEEAASAHESGFLMKTSMIVLAILCFGIAVLSPQIVPALNGVVWQVSRISSAVVDDQLSSRAATLSQFVIASVVFAGLLAILFVIRRALLNRRTAAEAGTWDCGYAKPCAKMQYTASSFANPIADMFRVILKTHEEKEKPEGLFPRKAALHTETPDTFQRFLFRPIFSAIEWIADKLRFLQHGNVHLYILYIVLTLLALLIWQAS